MTSRTSNNGASGDGIGHHFVNSRIEGDAFGEDHFDAEEMANRCIRLVDHLQHLGVLARHQPGISEGSLEVEKRIAKVDQGTHVALLFPAAEACCSR